MSRPILPVLAVAWLLSGFAGWPEQSSAANLSVVPRWNNVPLYADQPSSRPADLEASHQVSPGRQVLLENVLNEFAWPAPVEQSNGQWLRIRDDGRCNESGARWPDGSASTPW